MSFDKNVQVILDKARLEADRFNHDYVGTEHILLAFVARHESFPILEKFGVTEGVVKRQVEMVLQSGPSMSVLNASKPFTPRAKKVLEFAAEEAKNQAPIQLWHLLVGMVREEDGLAATVLRELGVTLKACRIAEKGDLPGDKRFIGVPAAKDVATVPPKTSAGDKIDFGEPCEHVEKFREELKNLYSRNKNFVSLDEPLNFHCHSCSAIFKIPEDLMRPKPGDTTDAKKPQLVITRFRAVTSINVPDFTDGSPTVSHATVLLDPPVTLWLASIQDGVGEWRETFASEAEKDAFVKGFRATSVMRGDHSPIVVEIQK